MDVRDYLSDEGQAIVALCSALALSDAPDAPAPFTLSEWNSLEKQIEASSFKVPSELQGRAAEEIAAALSVPHEEAERIHSLLARSSRVAMELESFFSKGVWAVTRIDEHYPDRLRSTLKHQAPSVLFGAGEIRLLGKAGVAVVGSRNIDQAGISFATEVGRKAVASGIPVVSGGARGTDRIAMQGAIDVNGTAIGALADSLEATVRKPDVRDLVLDGRLVLLTPYAPTAGFSVGGAMGRNKLIYGLAAYAVVVSSDFQTGGTWAGAVEALKAGWCPVFVRDGRDVPKGNAELLKKGAVPLTNDELESTDDLVKWMRKNAAGRPVEQDLFGRV